MEEKEFTVTSHEYWKNTFRSVEDAHCWLKNYGGKDHGLVEKVLTSLRRLVTHGKNYEAMKTYKLPIKVEATTAFSTSQDVVEQEEQPSSSLASLSGLAQQSSSSTPHGLVQQYSQNNELSPQSSSYQEEDALFPCDLYEEDSRLQTRASCTYPIDSDGQQKLHGDTETYTLVNVEINNSAVLDAMTPFGNANGDDK